jgi:hypothetical protein
MLQLRKFLEDMPEAPGTGFIPVGRTDHSYGAAGVKDTDAFFHIPCTPWKNPRNDRIIKTDSGARDFSSLQGGGRRNNCFIATDDNDVRAENNRSRTGIYYSVIP